MVAKNTSRADYFRERRKKFKQFTVSIPQDKLEKFDERLRKIGITRVAWINEKIDDELKK